MTTLMLPMSSMRSLVPPIVLFGVAPHYYMTSSALRIMKYLIPQRIYEQLDCVMYHSYQSLVTYFFETFSGTQVFFYGDSLPENVDENVLYISNHQSAIDWSLTNFLGIRQHSLGKIRYIMKSVLKYIPFFGPYFVQHGCIFVKKQSNTQDLLLRRELQKFAEDRCCGYWLVIFPEGTRISSQKIDLLKKSEEMAKQNGKWYIRDRAVSRLHFGSTGSVNAKSTTLQKCVIPKNKGNGDELKNLDAVYNLTIAFKTPWLPAISRQIGPDLFEMVSVYGREIHIHFHRIPVQHIPQDTNEQRKMIYSLFQEKDKLLTYFYDDETNGRFPGNSYQIPLKINQTVPYFVFYTSVLVATLVTDVGRKWYIRSWMFGLGSLLCMPILYRLKS